MKVKGYYTVEAVFIVTICVWVMVALCFGGLYIHDRLVMEVVTNGTLVHNLAQNSDCTEKELEDAVKGKLQNQVFLMRISKVSVSKKILSCDADVVFSLPISLHFLKKIFSQNGLHFSTSRENICAAKYKWDYDILFEKK